MRSFKSLSTITILFFIACSGRQSAFNSAPEFVGSIKTFKKQIPTYKTGKLDLYYLMVRTKQQQLGLDNIENGFNNLQIRLWTDSSFVKNQKLIVVTNKGVDWTANVYNLEVDWDGQTETIRSKTKMIVNPKSGWTIFVDKLMDLKVLTLPNCDELLNYSGRVSDGHAYNIEIATTNQYRFYTYSNPEMLKEEYWQAKNMTEILTLFKIELGL